MTKTLNPKTMSNETLYDLRCYVSDCFNHREGAGASSGYMMLSKLMKEEYDLDNNDVDEVVSEIEDMVSKFIKEHSPKFQDNDE
jgi:hypothetical protein